MKIMRKYFDEAEWQEIDRETACAGLSGTFYAPEAILAKMEEAESARIGAGRIQTAFATYCVVAQEDAAPA